MLSLLIDGDVYVKKPSLVFFLSIFISSISVILSLNLLGSMSSIVVITFTIIPLIPIMMRFFGNSSWSNRYIQKRLVKFYTWLFLGLIISYSFWFTFLPNDVSKRVFSEQLKQYYNLGYSSEKGYQFNYGAENNYYFERCDANVLNTIMENYHYDIVNCEVVLSGTKKKSYLLYLGSSTGFADYIYNVNTGIVYPYRYFLRAIILSNNLKLLLFIFLTSFIFGAGSFFIIAWNASIISIYIGLYAIKLYDASSKFFMSKFFYWLIAFFYAARHIILHSIFEFAGFFLAAIAGGFFSVALLKNSKKNTLRKELKIIKSAGLRSLIVFLFSAFLIIIAAFIETI